MGVPTLLPLLISTEAWLRLAPRASQHCQSIAQPSWGRSLQEVRTYLGCLFFTFAVVDWTQHPVGGFQGKHVPFHVGITQGQAQHSWGQPVLDNNSLSPEVHFLHAAAAVAAAHVFRYCDLPDP